MATLSSGLSGRALTVALSEQVDALFRQLATDLPADMAVAAMAGYARHELCPGSDIDVWLIHDRHASNNKVEETSKQLWYPLWDAGLKVSPAVHSVESAVALARSDLVTATTLLATRHLAGDSTRTADVADRGLALWRERAAKHWLPELHVSVLARHTKNGEVAYLLEPDLKEGRGGLRDVHAVEWARASGHPALAQVQYGEPSTLAPAFDVLLAVRSELHRVTKRTGDRLLLQEQDVVAEGLGYRSADALLAAVSEAARQIVWECDEFWRQVTDALDRSPARRRANAPVLLAADCLLVDEQVELTADAAPAQDPTMILRIAALAALAGSMPSRATLRRLADEAAPPEPIWSDATRHALVSLLGAGQASLRVLESLDQERLFERVLPEWAAVRCHPQRNAFHQYTVDRHLWQTAINASSLVRRVARPDLLLIGALLHDIGKGYPGDHTEVGMRMIADIGARMGFPPEDIEVLVGLVQLHLLLPETATRRDISDAGTIAVVANAVVDADRLALLHALVQADSMATGPTAWSDWKAGLLAELVGRVEGVLSGHRPAEVSDFPEARHLAIIESVRQSGKLELVASADSCTVAALDRTGLFSTVAGVLSMHSVDVVSADVWTGDDGVAIEEYRINRRLGGDTNWKRVAADLEQAFAGEIDLDAKLAEKVKAYGSVARSRRLAHVETPRAEVLIDNDTSQDATIVEIRAPDGIGVLYRVTSVLARFGADIRHAKVVTLGHEVVDAFYVRCFDKSEAISVRVPRKISDGDEADRLREALLAVLIES